MSSHGAFRSKWEVATIQVGAPGDVNIETSDKECPRRIESFSRYFLGVKGDTYETKRSTDALLAGGIVVTPELINSANELDPVCCCYLLGLKLKNGGMSYGDVSKYLTKNRHKNKSGGKWTPNNVYSIMKNHMNDHKITPVLV